MPEPTPSGASMGVASAVPNLLWLPESSAISVSPSSRMRSSVKARDTRPRACAAMKLIASGVARSAATKRSPSFSRSSSSTRISMRPLRTSGNTCSTMDSLVWVILAYRGNPSRSVAALRDQADKLGARAVLLKFAGKRGRRRDRMLFLDAAHDHAQVLRFNHHRDAQRLQCFLNAIAAFDREPLLHLQPARKRVDHARDFRQADDMSVGDIGDVRLAEKRQYVVLAQRVDLDIFHDHHLLILFLEHRRAQDRRRIEIVAVREKLQRFGNALGGFDEAFACRVFTQRREHVVIAARDALDRIVIVLIDLGIAVVAVARGVPRGELLLFCHEIRNPFRSQPSILPAYSASFARIAARMPPLSSPQRLSCSAGSP